MTPRDPGLQPERTRLAWRRTVLAITGVALLAERLVLVRQLGGALAAVIALVWLWTLVVTQRRVRALARGEEPGWSSGLALTVAVCGFALLGVVLVGVRA